MPAKPTPSDAFEAKLIFGLFALTIAFGLWAVSVGWTNPNLYGNEFRQTQTAISAQFIQRDHNFSLAYPTPILGKPWSIPFEFPLYQWAVAVTSNATGWSLAASGRGVAAFCFYAGLPALFLLLRRLGLQSKHGLIVLSLIITCPLYIFYARAVLIETMALMFGLWYLAALVKTMERRNWSWLVLVNIAGIGAGLVKVTTFLVFLMPAFACSLGWLWKSLPRREKAGCSAFSRTLLWLVSSHALAFATTLWWLHFSDGVKLLNPNSVIFTSANLTTYNFGIGHRLDPATWGQHWKIISQEITPPVLLIAGGLVAIFFARHWWREIGGCIGLYLLVQAVFPVLYAAHTYYHVAAAFLLMCGLGFAVVGMFEDQRLHRIIPFTAWVGFIALQVCLYFGVYYPTQHTRGNPGGLVDVLREITRPEEAVVIAGDDWSSIIPYYAGRRALMLMGSFSHDEAHLRKTFALMKTQAVGALVLMNSERDNPLVLRLAAEYLGIESPAFLICHDRGSDSAIYLNRQVESDALAVLKERQGYFTGVSRVEKTAPSLNPLAGVVFDYNQLLPRNEHFFKGMNPRPIRFYSTFGPELWDENKPGQELYAAHPDTKLWFHLSPGHHQLNTALEVLAGAYQGVPYADASDGVELVAAAIDHEGNREILQQRYFNPRDNPADRGLQPIDWSFDLPANNELELSVNAGPKGNAARDWTGLSAIVIK